MVFIIMLGVNPIKKVLPGKVSTIKNHNLARHLRQHHQLNATEMVIKKVLPRKISVIKNQTLFLSNPARLLRQHHQLNAKRMVIRNAHYVVTCFLKMPCSSVVQSRN